jgi:hypothetical protein
MTNRLTQIIAEMEEGDAKKIETLTGVFALGGHFAAVARGVDKTPPDLAVAARTIVGDALAYMLGRTPTAEEVDQVLSGGF